MYLHVYRTVLAEGLRHDDHIDLGDGRSLVVDEVHLKREGVDVGGMPPKSDSTRRSWVKFKYGDGVRVLADDDDVRGVLDALHNALGFASAEWEDRNAPDDVNAPAPAPPWHRFDNGPSVDFQVRGYWFSVALPQERDRVQILAEPEPDDPGQTDPAA